MPNRGVQYFDKLDGYERIWGENPISFSKGSNFPQVNNCQQTKIIGGKEYDGVRLNGVDRCGEVDRKGKVLKTKWNFYQICNDSQTKNGAIKRSSRLTKGISKGHQKIGNLGSPWGLYLVGLRVGNGMLQHFIIRGTLKWSRKFCLLNVHQILGLVITWNLFFHVFGTRFMSSLRKGCVQHSIKR
jgi:hypothetical protein